MSKHCEFDKNSEFQYFFTKNKNINMLKSYLSAAPPPKFIIIEDNIEERGYEFLDYLLKSKNDTKINYMTFFGNSQKLNSKLHQKYKNYVIYNYSNNFLNKTPLEEILNIKGSVNDTLVIDSLAHLIIRYGAIDAYKCCHALYKKGFKQVICLFHTDLIENVNEIRAMFQYLGSLFITLEPKVGSSYNRITYLYKKQKGKFIRSLEEYKIENGELTVKNIDKPDINKLQESLRNEVDPSQLSTFKISLTDDEKKARDEVVLPYLPRNQSSEGGGRIFYDLDAQDDWDEEDPDDDLGI